MNWAYVAGFFDGEGCVRHQGNKWASQITIVQSTKQDAVIFAIQEFLISEGVRANVHHSSGFWGRDGDRVRGLRTLSVGESSSLILFLENVLPFLIVKRDKAIEALQRAKAVQKKKDATADRLREAVELYKSGASTLELRHRCGLNHNQIRAHFKRIGVQLRDARGAALLRHSKRRHLTSTAGSSLATACSS